MAEKWDISSDTKWSDGAAVSADDFVYAWRRVLAPETASDYAFILWPIDGAESYSKGAQKDPASIGVKALDPQTLEVHLKAPTPYFLGMLMHHMAYPLPKAVVEKFGKDWTKLEKSPNYRRAKEVGVDTVYYIPTDQTGWVTENLPDAFHNSPYIGTYYYALNLDNAAFKYIRRNIWASNLELNTLGAGKSRRAKGSHGFRICGRTRGWSLYVNATSLFRA